MAVHLGLGMNLLPPPSTDARILAGVFGRAYVTGRDGTIVQSGGTGGSVLCPWTGSTVASGGICGFTLPVPGGGSIRFCHAQGQRINSDVNGIMSGMTTAEAGWSVGGSSPAGTAYKLTPTTASAIHRTFSLATVVDATAYTNSVLAKADGYRYLYINGAATPNRGKATFDLIAGTVQVTDGTASITSLGNGWYRCSVTGTSSGTSHQRYIQINDTNTVGDKTFAGDGTSGVLLSAPQLEAGSFAGVYIATAGLAITRTADNIVWTPPAALSTTSGELVSIAVPYAWSAAAGAANPTAADMRTLFHSSASVSRLTAGNDAVSLTDAGGVQTAAATSLAAASGAMSMTTAKWSTDLRLYRGATLAATDSTGISAPWAAIDTLNIGSNATPTEAFFGAVAALYVPGGLTDTERAALARYFNGKAKTIYG